VVSGTLRTGHNVQVGFLSQHTEVLDIGGARTVLEACQHATGLKPGPARALLGKFLFSGDDAEKPLDGLSGGERRRLALAIVVQSGANVLVLDEPTNHLDIEGREALETALSEFPGSVLLISHDRALLDAVGTRTIAFEDGTLRSYVGGWAEYMRVRAEREAEEAAAKARQQAAAAKRQEKASAVRKQDKPAAKARRQPGKTSQDKLERQIEQAEAALQAVEDELADPGAWATPERSAQSTGKHAAAKRKVDKLYARYEELVG
jgi:ATP-binding cassette subfamily F protein 3